MAEKESHYLIGGTIRDVQSGNVLQGDTKLFVDPTTMAGHVALRPLEYAGFGQVLGHYRAASFSGAVNTLLAADILASLWWRDATRYFVLTRLSVNAEIITAITTAAPIDVAAFVFRGGTAASSGTGSSTLTLTTVNQRMRFNMGTSLLASSPQGAGEIRTVGTTTTLTAVAGRTNDSAPFGVAFLHGGLLGVTATGTAVAVPVAGGLPAVQDLFVAGPYTHPLVLTRNEGIEIQTITATATDGGIKYGFLWEWAEVVLF